MVVFLLPCLAIAQTTATSQTVENGAITTPIVWSTNGGCIYNWFNATTGAGLQTSGSGDIAPFKAINNTSLPITLTITASPVPRPILAYIPSQATNRVTVVNTTDYTIVAQIPVGKTPYGVAVSPDGTRVYVTNFGDNNVSVIDAVKNTVITNLYTGKGPRGIAVSPDNKRVYVADSIDREVAIIDAENLKVINYYKTDNDLFMPSTVTVSPDGLYVYSGGITNMFVYNVLTNKVALIDFNAAHAGIFTSHDGNLVYGVGAVQAHLEYADGTPTEDYFATYGVHDITTKKSYHYNIGPFSAKGAAISPDDSHIYIASPAFDMLSIVKTQSNTLERLVNVGKKPVGVSVDPKGLVYVVNYDSNDISVIDPSANSSTPINSFKTGDTQPFALGNFITGNTCTSSAPITYTITINPSPPTIITDGTPAALTTPANIPCPPTKIDVSGINLTEGISVTPPAGFEVSLDGLTYSPTLVIGNGGTPPPVPLYIRLAFGNAVGTYSGDILLKSAGATDVKVAVTGTITQAIPYVIASAASGSITACEGSASASPKLQQFTVSGTLLTGDILLTAPANFEISRSATSGFGNNLTLTRVGATVAATTIYVRSAASAKGVISGNVSVTSNGANPLQVAVKGVVAAPPTVNAVANQTLFGGQNTQAVNFTGTGNSYSWVNDNPSIGLAASGDGNITAFKAINNGTTDVVAHITVTPHNDPLAYVANFNLNAVSVINTLTSKIVNTITVARAPYAAVVSPDGTSVYIANQNSGLVSVINTASGTVGNLTVGSNPSGLALSADGSTLYVTNGNQNTVQMLDANSHGLLATITVGNTPQGVAVSPNGSWAYVANRNSNSISVISSALRQKLLDIGVGTSPESVAVSPDGSLVYVTNYNSRSVSVISTADNRVIDAIQVGANPRGIAINQDGSIIYVTNYGSKAVSVIRTSDRSIIKNVPVGDNPEGISLSPDGKLVYVANYGSNNVTVINTADNSTNTTIGLPGSPVSFGNFIVAGTGCAGNAIQFTITVKPSVQHIFVSDALSALTTIYGTPSKAISFRVSADNMSEGILVTPPNGFEVSADGTTFDKTTFVGTSGTIPQTPVYLRLAATTPVGNNYAGDIQLTSTGVPDLVVATVKSTVTKAPVIVTANNLQRNYGKDTPTLTAGYTGFVNGEDETVLTALPVITSTATAASPPGKYPVKAEGAAAANYDFTYVNGTLTVLDINGIQPVIPNAFSPNGDGINDTWIIKNLDTFPNCTVDIYTRGGRQVYHSVNYTNPWNGKYNGSNLPAGVYYYVINLNNGSSPLSGYVAVIR